MDYNDNLHTGHRRSLRNGFKKCSRVHDSRTPKTIFFLLVLHYCFVNKGLVNGHGYLFQILGDPCRYNVLGRAKVVIKRAKDGGKGGRECEVAIPKWRMGWHAKRTKGLP